MKYMGSKAAMLRNGLGDLLLDLGRRSDRIVDLFCGSGSVAWFACQNLPVPVYAIDLQSYSAVLAKAVIQRSDPVMVQPCLDSWFSRARAALSTSIHWKRAYALDSQKLGTANWSRQARRMCRTEVEEVSAIWSCYGGYYFSPTQAAAFDALNRCLPRRDPHRSVCLASLIIAASKCVASPGHTAQPFKPNATAGRYLREAWLRDPFVYVGKALNAICPQHAQVRGKAVVGDALEEAKNLSSGDLVFIDPPYSGVHYSRFYHVLETIARGDCGPVEGEGRYPPPDERPVSSFSRKTEAFIALANLFTSISENKCRAIITFPNNMCSNGLSGEAVADEARRRFKITKKVVKTRFSTLGGNNYNRDARQMSEEMILYLEPKRRFLRNRSDTT